MLLALSADTDPDDDAENSDPLSFLPFEGTAKQIANWIAVFLAIWLLLNGVGMIAGGLPLNIAIPMLFGANMGTSVTSTLVALGLAGNKKQFRNGFSMATVHDFFNLIAILFFFTLEMLTGFLGKTAEDVDKFVTTYLEHSEAVMPRVFFYQLPEEDYGNAQKRYADRKTGPDDRWQS